MLDLPLRTQGIPWREVPDPYALLPDALRLTMRAPDELAPLYVGGPVAYYRGPTAADAAVAHGLLADGALVAPLDPQEAAVLQTADVSRALPLFREFVTAVAQVNHLAPPPVWVFQQSTLVAVVD